MYVVSRRVSSASSTTSLRMFRIPVHAVRMLSNALTRAIRGHTEHTRARAVEGVPYAKCALAGPYEALGTGNPTEVHIHLGVDTRRSDLSHSTTVQ